MSYQIRVLPTARRALTQRLPERVASAAYQFLCDTLAHYPPHRGYLTYGPLNGLRVASCGSLRVLYRIEEDVLVVVDVLYRDRVYWRR